MGPALHDGAGPGAARDGDAGRPTGRVPWRPRRPTWPVVAGLAAPGIATSVRVAGGGFGSPAPIGRSPCSTSSSRWTVPGPPSGVPKSGSVVRSRCRRIVLHAHLRIASAMGRAEEAWRASLASTSIADLLIGLAGTVAPRSRGPGRGLDAGGPVMKIFVAGATGVLGRGVVPLLVAAGHDVTAVVEPMRRRNGSAPPGPSPWRWISSIPPRWGLRFGVTR